MYLIEDEGDVDKIIGTHENGTPYTEIFPVHDDDNDSVSSRYLLIKNNFHDYTNKLSIVLPLHPVPTFLYNELFNQWNIQKEEAPK